MAETYSVTVALKSGMLIEHSLTLRVRFSICVYVYCMLLCLSNIVTFHSDSTLVHTTFYTYTLIKSLLQLISNVHWLH